VHVCLHVPHAFRVYKQVSRAGCGVMLFPLKVAASGLAFVASLTPVQPLLGQQSKNIGVHASKQQPPCIVDTFEQVCN